MNVNGFRPVCATPPQQVGKKNVGFGSRTPQPGAEIPYYQAQPADTSKHIQTNKGPYSFEKFADGAVLINPPGKTGDTILVKSDQTVLFAKSGKGPEIDVFSHPNTVID